METSDIINDIIHYPLTDYKKFFVLGLPLLVISIISTIWMYQYVEINKLASLPEVVFYSEPIFQTYFMTLLLLFIVVVLGTIIIQGIGISVIRETINDYNYLPGLDIRGNFIDGIKAIIVTLIFFGVPTLIYIILTLFIGAVLGENSIIILLLLMLLYLVALLLLLIIYCPTLCRLAETDSISKALKIKETYEITKNIGFLKIFSVLIICFIINIVLSVIGSFIQLIPLVGIVIYVYVLLNYSFLISYRSYGLLYKDSFVNNQYRSIDSKSIDTIRDNDMKAESVKPAYNENSSNSSDYRPRNSVNKVDSSNDSGYKKCMNCGHENPGFINTCMNCGNKL